MALLLPPTAGIIVIGDEILKGHVQDTNSNYLCKELWSFGIKVVKISVVGDCLNGIAEEVNDFSSRFDFVLTCGGVGPTHDDVTMEGIAKAFREDVCSHPSLLRLLFNEDKSPPDDHPLLKMTMVAKSARVYTNDKRIVCPLVVVNNVYAFPGLPSALQDTFEIFKYFFVTENKCQFFLKSVFFEIDEDKLAAPLRHLQEEYHTVQIGSYPDDSKSVAYRVKVTFEGQDTAFIEKAYCSLLLKLSPDYILTIQSNYSLENDCKARESLSWLEEYFMMKRLFLVPSSLLLKIEETVRIMEQTLEIYRPEDLCVAFTGGKDCTVLLALYVALITKKKERHDIKALCVVPAHTFPEVDEFIDSCVTRYHLEIIKEYGSIQTALLNLKVKYPEIKAILMGTRSTDPHSDSLSEFSPTDSEWPNYMRIHCILKWSYSDIWLFLRIFRVPYCRLYDVGYTSLGDSDNTRPNPALKYSSTSLGISSNAGVSSQICVQYQPAYLLKDYCLEREGRSKN